jgi:hypothetical protein
MTQGENAFDEGWLEWLTGCYRRSLPHMPDDQKRQLEAAFYAGAAFAGRCAQRHGHPVVIAAIEAHIERTKRLEVECPKCEKRFARTDLIDDEACPLCRLVL